MSRSFPELTVAPSRTLRSDRAWDDRKLFPLRQRVICRRKGAGREACFDYERHFGQSRYQPVPKAEGVTQRWIVPWMLGNDGAALLYRSLEQGEILGGVDFIASSAKDYDGFSSLLQSGLVRSRIATSRSARHDAHALVCRHPGERFGASESIGRRFSGSYDRNAFAQCFRIAYHV